MKKLVSRTIFIVGILACLVMVGSGKPRGVWAETSENETDAPTTVIVLRHADQVADSENPPLSDAGRARAQVLAQVCGSSVLAALYGITYRGEDLRVRQTLEPAANLLNLEPAILLQSDRIQRLVHDLQTTYRGKTVLVVSHYGDVQDIVKALGGDDTLCPTTTHDNLCVVTLYGVGKAKVLRLKYGAIASH